MEHPIKSAAGTQWHAEFTDLVAPMSSPRAVLEEYRDSAPNAAAAAYCQAFIDARIEIAAVTGAKF